MHIYLIGFMGSGKSYWGKKWADAVKAEFVDLDLLVEAMHGPIGDIFAEKGETYFRDLETDFLRELSGKKNCIVATGGGTPCFNDNITWMNENGRSVYLRSSPGHIMDRLWLERKKRPLIKNLNDEELLYYIIEKIRERESFYNQASVIIDVDDLPENFIPGFLNT
jgi:shikimate kinase